jgi:acyl-CoA thioesterase I
MKIKIVLSALILFVLLQSCATYKTVPEESGQKYRLAAVGDSITYGLGIGNRFRNSYPAQLENMLGAQWAVGNFGKNGATLLSRGDRPYIESGQYADALEFKPDIVIIMLGTNDSKPQNKQYRDEFLKDYLELINSFQSLESKPLICLCYPVPSFGGFYRIDDNVLLNEIIPVVETVAERSGVPVIDLYSVLSSRGDLFPDSVHPDREGALIIAGKVYSFLRENFSSFFYGHTSRHPLLSEDFQM